MMDIKEINVYPYNCILFCLYLQRIQIQICVFFLPKQTDKNSLFLMHDEERQLELVFLPATVCSYRSDSSL